jgi:integrase
MASIQALDVIAMLRAISDRGVSDLAKRAMQVTKAVFGYAVTHQVIEHSPVAHLKPNDILPKTTKTNYARVDAKELPKLLHAIDGYQGEQTKLAMQILAHTFVRTSELIGAKWEEIDIEGARWSIPASRMKMKTAHIVPLSRQSLAILARLKELSGASAFVFPGLRPRSHMSNGTILVALKRMGYVKRMTGHGFRGIASTILHEQQVDHEHIELQLAHQQRNAVSAAYNHAKHLKARAEMMQHWSDHLDTLTHSKVVSIA